MKTITPKFIIHNTDPEKDAEAREWSDTLNQSIHPFNCIIRARPSYRGGWKVGYIYSGRFKVTFSWVYNTFGSMREKSFYTEKDTEKVYRYYLKNIAPIIAIDVNAMRLNSIYRKSGLIPKHIAKKHSEKGKELGVRNFLYTDVGGKLISGLMTSYLLRYAKCPSCGEKGFNEWLVGWKCKHCCSVWDDEKHEWGKSI